MDYQTAHTRLLLPSGYTFSPASKSVTVSGANVTGVNFTGSPSGGGITFIQGNNGFTGSSASSLTVAYSKAQTAGDTNFVVVYAGNNTRWTVPPISSVSDNITGKYTLVGQVGGVDVSAYIYLFSGIKSASAGADKVTVRMAVTVIGLGISVFEYSGLPSSPLDGMVQKSANWSANASITPVTTTNAKDLIFAVVVGDSNQQFTAGARYTLRPGMEPGPA